MGKERLEYFDVFKGVCMAFVVLSHATNSHLWYSVYTPFFLSGFFFISGYFFTNPAKPISWAQKMTNIFTSIFLPYFLYLVITNVLLGIHDWSSILPNIVNALIQGRKLWFVSVLIIGEVLCSVLVINKISKIGGGTTTSYSLTCCCFS